MYVHIAFYYYMFYNQDLVNQLDTSDSVVVNNGQFQVYINNGLPKIYYPSSDMDVPLDIHLTSKDEHNRNLSEYCIVHNYNNRTHIQ